MPPVILSFLSGEEPPENHYFYNPITCIMELSLKAYYLPLQEG